MTASLELDGWVRRQFGVNLTTTASPVGLDLRQLVGLALRRNPRRAHLLVSLVLGKHIPADPRVIRGVGQLLGVLVAHQALSADLMESDRLRVAAAELLAGHSTDLLPELVAEARQAGSATLVFGFAETATGLGHCVAEALGAPWYLHSTRRQVAGVAVSAGFEEGHSHATSHLVQPVPAELLSTGDVLVLVDDEFSTGTTAMAAIDELHRLHPRRQYVVAALIDLRDEIAITTMNAFADSLGSHISVVSLVSGAVEFPADLAAAAAAFIAAEHTEIGRSTGADPVSADVSRVDIGWPAGLPEGGRHGFQASDYPAFDVAVEQAAKSIRAALPETAHRILVLGTEEFMYLPLRLAGAIADTHGLEARFQTTTRSPVHPEPAVGYPVGRAFEFVSPEGDVVAAKRYFYNADWRTPTGRPSAESPDAVVLVIDQPMDRPELSAANGLIDALGALAKPIVLAVVSADPADEAQARSKDTG